MYFPKVLNYIAQEFNTFVQEFNDLQSMTCKKKVLKHRDNELSITAFKSCTFNLN